MAIVAVNITPLGNSSSVSTYVTVAEKVLVTKAGIKWQIGPMATTIEGDLDEILQAIREMQEAVFAFGAARVATTIQIDDRRDKAITMEGKIRAVEEKLL